MEARNAAIKQTMLSTAMLTIMMAVFYFSAGRIDIPRSWFLFSGDTKRPLPPGEPVFLAQNAAANRSSSG